MSDNSIYAAQTNGDNTSLGNDTSLENNVSFGSIEIFVTSTQGLIPIPNATVTITYPNAPDTFTRTLSTDESGQTEIIALPAPAFALSQQPSEIQPYTEYTIEVTAPGYEPVTVTGTEILPDVIALQPILKKYQPSPKKIYLFPNILSSESILPKFRRMKSNP